MKNLTPWTRGRHSMARGDGIPSSSAGTATLNLNYMPESLYYPKVLVCCSYSFSHVDQNSITLCNHFQKWPSERLALVTNSTTPPLDNTCGHYWKIPKRNSPLIKMLKRICISSDRPAHTQMVNRSVHDENNETVLNFLHKRSRLSTIIHSCGSMLPLKLNEYFWEWVNNFQPEVIYSTIPSIGYCDATLKISKRLSIPIVPHSTDDHYSGAVISSFIQKMPWYYFRTKMRQVYRRTPIAIAYSELMATGYERLFHIPHEVIMNTSNDIIDNFPETRLQNERPFRLVYIGGMHLERWQVLHNIAKAVSKLNDEGNHIEMIIHCAKGEFDCYAEHLDIPPFVRFGGTLTQSEILSAIDSSDLPVHVESFDEKMRKYTRLSVSTKIPTYFSRAKPIFVCAPAEVASYQYIANTKTGIVIDDQDPTFLANELRKLMDNRNLLNQLAMNAWNIAKNNHCKEIVCEKLRKILCHAIKLSDINKHSRYTFLKK